MEKRTITIYIDGRSYQLAIIVNHVRQETMYEVIANGNALSDFVPESIGYQDDEEIEPEERVRTVESEQIARIIWTEILDKMNS